MLWSVVRGEDLIETGLRLVWFGVEVCTHEYVCKSECRNVVGVRTWFELSISGHVTKEKLSISAFVPSSECSLSQPERPNSTADSSTADRSRVSMFAKRVAYAGVQKQ